MKINGQHISSVSRQGLTSRTMKVNRTLQLMCVLLSLTCSAGAQPARPRAKAAVKDKYEGVTPVTTSEPSTTFRTNTVITYDSQKQPIGTNVQVISVTTTSVTNPVVDGKIVNPQETNAILSILNNHVVLNSGVVLLNPYVLTTNGLTGSTKNRRRLEKSDGTDAKFFIDLAVNYVWAWDTDRRARFAAARKDANGATGHDGGEFIWDNGWHDGLPLDLQGHIAYYASDSKQTTVSAMVGSGSFGTEVTIGLPIYRSIYTADSRVESGEHLTAQQRNAVYDNTTSVHWIGLVASYSAVTDSGAFDVHDRFLLGLGYRAAFKTPFEITGGSRNREVVLSLTCGVAGVDTVSFLNDNTKEVKLHHEDVPDYHTRACLALESEAYYPVTDSLSAVVGARIYSGLDPNTWNSYFGLTIPLDKIAGLLK